MKHSKKQRPVMGSVIQKQLLIAGAFLFMASAHGSIAANPYSGQIALNNSEYHQLTDYKRIDENVSSDALFGSTSIQEKPTMVFNSVEIEIMNAGEEVDDYTVNGKECPTGKTFHAFVTPVATCSAVHGRNFSGFRAVAVTTTGTKWKPMLYMNANGRWIDMSINSNIGSVSPSRDECRKLLVQKICQ